MGYPSCISSNKLLDKFLHQNQGEKWERRCGMQKREIRHTREAAGLPTWWWQEILRNSCAASQHNQHFRRGQVKPCQVGGILRRRNWYVLESSTRKLIWWETSEKPSKQKTQLLTTEKQKVTRERKNDRNVTDRSAIMVGWNGPQGCPHLNLQNPWLS